jgi:hypothetical protein
MWGLHQTERGDDGDEREHPINKKYADIIHGDV